MQPTSHQVKGGDAAGFLALDPSYPGLHLVLQDPPIYTVDDFLTSEECDALVMSADGRVVLCMVWGGESGHLVPAPVVGAGDGVLNLSRTSSTCYFDRSDTPSLMSKVCKLTRKPIEHIELPQVGRYLPSQEYKAHYDAFDLSTEDGRRFARNGGQRVATVLVYLNDVARGGKTSFHRLHLTVTPKKGMALVFFPATLDGVLDDRALHAADPAGDVVKWVSQVWIRQREYSGIPTRRIGSPI